MRTVMAILTEDSSCSCALAVRWRRRRRLARMYSKEPLEEVARGGGCGRDSAGHGSISSTAHFSLRICFWFDIRRSVRTCQLHSGTLRLVCTLFVVASQVPSRIVKAHRFDQLERIGV